MLWQLFHRQPLAQNSTFKEGSFLHTWTTLIVSPLKPHTVWVPSFCPTNFCTAYTNFEKSVCNCKPSRCLLGRGLLGSCPSALELPPIGHSIGSHLTLPILPLTGERRALCAGIWRIPCFDSLWWCSQLLFKTNFDLVLYFLWL